jgi:hypothetical protein
VDHLHLVPESISLIRIFIRSMTTSLHDAQASPATLLKAIRTYLTPIPNLSTLSSALTIFANFQLLSQRLQHEARRALSLNSTRISAKFEWGGLSTREIRWLNGLLQRNRCEGMRVFSAEIRRHVSFHLARLNVAYSQGTIDSWHGLHSSQTLDQLVLS